MDRTRNEYVRGGLKLALVAEELFGNWLSPYSNEEKVGYKNTRYFDSLWINEVYELST